MFDNIHDRLLQVELKRDEKRMLAGFLILGTLLLILIANVVYLNINKNSKSNPQTNAQITTAPSTAMQPTSTPTTLPTIAISQPTPAIIQQSLGAKNYYIPLGTGSNQSNDWADIPGAQVTVDLSSYGNISKVLFEASTFVPTANEIIWVRLFNKTDNHTVWNSEIEVDQNINGFLTSPPLIYDSGEKTYSVQMKTQLQAVVNLTQSRIHIVLK